MSKDVQKFLLLYLFYCWFVFYTDVIIDYCSRNSCNEDGTESCTNLEEDEGYKCNCRQLWSGVHCDGMLWYTYTQKYMFQNSRFRDLISLASHNLSKNLYLHVTIHGVYNFAVRNKWCRI